MNSKEVSEIRRRFKFNQNTVGCVRGILVGEDGEIVTEFHQYMHDLPEDEVNMIYAVARKTLMGTVGKNLVDIEFSNEQVMYGEEFKLLNTMREEELKNDETLHAFYEKAVASIQMEGAYLLTLTYDEYDVFAKKENGEKADESEEMFRYFVCSVCPVKNVQDTLSFYPYEKRFRRISADTVVGTPQFGFLFPAFDDRSCNIYGALLYTKDDGDNHEPFVDAVFHAPVPMPAANQKQNFNEMLAESLDDDCGLNVVKNVQRGIRDMVNERKELKIVEPLRLNKREMTELLETAGADQKHLEAFAEKFDDVFGANASVPPQNLVEQKNLQLKTADVVIKIAADHSDLVETRVIDGVKYILIRADEDVEVNGVNIKIK